MALTQIRLNQITGSAPNNFKPAAFAQGGTVNQAYHPDLSGSLGYFAQALSNIHGDLEYGNQIPGKISFATANNIELVGARSGGAQNVKLEQHDGTNGNGMQVVLNSTGTAAASSLIVKNVGGTGTGAIDIDASAGGIDVDAQLAVAIDSVASSIKIGEILADGQVMQLGKPGATEITLAPHGTPANEKIMITNSAGTAGDAIKLHADAGGIWLAADSANVDALNIDSGGGIDVDSVTAMTFTTADAAGDISFATAHTAGVAFLIDANADAGSIVQVDAGVLDQNVTGATTLDGASLAQTLSSTYDLDAGGAVTVDGASVSIGGDNDTVTVTSKSTGGDTTIEVAATGAGHDLILKQSGAQDAGVLVQAAGTGQDSIKLEALAGSIEISVIDGQSVAIGKGGGAEIMVTPHGTAGNEKILVDCKGTAADAIKLDSSGGLDFNAAGVVSLESTAGALEIGVAAVQQPISIGTGNAGRVLSMGASHAQAKSTLKGGGAGLFLSGSGATAAIALSASNGVVFAADGAMTSGAGYLGMKFANNTEFAAFRGKSMFSATTTVVGALNALATSVAGTEPTLFKSKLSAAYTAGANLTVTKVAGDAASLNNHQPQKMQVYWNGQQLLSGTVAEFGAGNCDYIVVGDGAARNLKFNFHGIVGDLVQVWDFS